MDFGMECIGQFVGEPASRRLVDEGFDRGNERAVTREPNGIMGPQAGIVEAGAFAEGIVAAAMSIAGQIVEGLEFAKDGEIGGGTEDLFEFGQSGDFVPQEVLAEELGVEGEGSHNVIVPPGIGIAIGTITQLTVALAVWRMAEEAMITRVRECFPHLL